MKIYLVEDCRNAPGRIYAVFRNEEDAEDFATWFESAQVVERTLQEGQPSIRGYNE